MENKSKQKRGRPRKDQTLDFSNLGDVLRIRIDYVKCSKELTGKNAQHWIDLLIESLERLRKTDDNPFKNYNRSKWKIIQSDKN